MYCVKPLIRLDWPDLIKRYNKSFVSYKHFNEKKQILEYCKRSWITLFPCRQCLPCINMFRFHWVKKCELEKLNHKYAYFVTLTYNDDNLPLDHNLNVKHVQNFIKYLRFLIKPYQVRYFCAGEYGSITNRPHYHLILFTDYEFDLDFLKNTFNGPLFKCDLMNKAWKDRGYIWVAFDINSASFAYVVSYSNKYKIKQVANQLNKVNDQYRDQLYKDSNLTGFQKYMEFDLNFKPKFKPEFITMSKKPPLGALTKQPKTAIRDYPSSLLRWLDKNVSVGKKTIFYKEIEKRQQDWYQFISSVDLYDLVEKNKSIYDALVKRYENTKHIN